MGSKFKKNPPKLRKDGTVPGVRGLPGKEDWATRDQTFTVAGIDDTTYFRARELIRANRMIMQKILDTTYSCDSVACDVRVMKSKKDKRYKVRLVPNLEKSKALYLLISGGKKGKASLTELREKWNKENEALSKEPLGLKFMSYVWDEGRKFIGVIRSTLDKRFDIPAYKVVAAGDRRGSKIVYGARLPILAHTRSTSHVEIVEEVVEHNDNKVDCIYLDVRLEPGKTLRFVVHGPYTGLNGKEQFRSCNDGILKMLRHAKAHRWVPSKAHLTMRRSGELRFSLSTWRPLKDRTKRAKERVMEFVSYTRHGAGKTEDRLYGFHCLVDVGTEKLDKYRCRSYGIDDIVERLYGISVVSLKLKRQLACVDRYSPKGRARKLKGSMSNWTKKRVVVLLSECHGISKRAVLRACAWDCATLKFYMPKNAKLAGQHAFPWYQLMLCLKSNCEYYGIELEVIEVKTAESRIATLAEAVDADMLERAEREKKREKEKAQYASL